MPNTTPMMQQYARAKREHRDAVLLFRLGDFYEMFGSDAEEVSRLLGLTLTSRQSVPMCGVPHHAARGYIARLLAAGKKVAICEQVSLPVEGRGLADRKVTEVITPGTATEDDYLRSEANNFLLAIGIARGVIVASWVDVSTGEWYLQELAGERRTELARLLARLAPRELLVQESLIEIDELRMLIETGDRMINRIPDWSFSVDEGHAQLQEHFGVTNLSGFGITAEDRAPAAAGALIEYITDTSRALLAHLRSITPYDEGSIVGLDESTQRNLEITRNLRDGGSTDTVRETLDYTCTAMGKRTLVAWLCSPLRDISEIHARQEDVAELVDNPRLLTASREQLSRVHDINRLSGRLAMERAHAKDLVALAGAVEHSLAALGLLDEASTRLQSIEARDLQDPAKTAKLATIAASIRSALVDEPATSLTEGRMIRAGHSSELDRLQEIKENSEQVLDAYLRQERESSGIASLKLRHNRVLGHFLEVTKANAARVPDHFIPRQSLTTCDRFSTARLSELESTLNEAAERVVDLEQELFLELRRTVAEEAQTLGDLGRLVGVLDVVASLAYAAGARSFVRPVVENSTLLRIVDGRHPVVEANLPAGGFVPNSIELDEEKRRFALVTGPNMAGKSTILRQTALIVLMAQIGSFVPASEARIGAVDRIFCRVGASDNLARGESTFLVEMSEAAHILRNATHRSLIIMDEIGRGTSTSDGIAIAQAVAEHIACESRARTLFATHFHELSELVLPGFFNLSLRVREHDGRIIFLRQIESGPSNESYGVHVARIAGVPEAVVARAQELLAQHHRGNHYEKRPTLRAEEATRAPSGPRAPSGAVGRGGDGGPQPSLFPVEEVVAKRIRSLQIDELRPIDALNELVRLREELDRC